MKPSSTTRPSTRTALASEAAALMGVAQVLRCSIRSFINVLRQADDDICSFPADPATIASKQKDDICCQVAHSQPIIALSGPRFH